MAKYSRWNEKTNHFYGYIIILSNCCRRSKHQGLYTGWCPLVWCNDHRHSIVAYIVDGERGIRIGSREELLMCSIAIIIAPY